MMNKRKLNALIVSVCLLLGIVWAAFTDHFPADWFKLDFLIDISSLFTVASFSVSGMLTLRLLAVSSQVVAIPYFLLQSPALMTPVGWTLLFLAINLYHITRILLEKRPIKFTPEEQQLYELAFNTFEPREFLKLLKLGEWKTAGQGEKFLVRGESITQIAVPVTGGVSARQDAGEVALLGPGELVGAGMALTDQPSAFNADFAEETQYMCWPVADIQKFMGKHPDLAIKFNDIVNRYLVAQINKLSLYIGDGNR
jgi:hypothetical protein